MRGIKRRIFLKNTLIAGVGAALIPGFLKAYPKKKSTPAKKVIVAGAGITGLAVLTS